MGNHDPFGIEYYKTYFMMNDYSGGMGVMMWIFMLLGIVLLFALIMWIVKQSKK